MKIFLDTACTENIRKFSANGMIDGVTTNPSLIAQYARQQNMSGQRVIENLAQLDVGPISVEVTERTAAGMIEQAEQWAALSKNFVIKTPLTPDGLLACRHLTKNKVRVNVTLCFSLNQALLAAKAGATYVSPFVGRLDDSGSDGIDLISKIAQIYDQNECHTQILAASLRHPFHVENAFLEGAHVVTISPSLFEKLFHHPMTDQGLAQFEKDWSKV